MVVLHTALSLYLLSLQDCAERAVKHSEIFFRDLIKSIEKCRCEVILLIRDQEKAAFSQAEKVIKDLEQEIAGMRRGLTELDQLSHEEDHVHFLQVVSLFLINLLKMTLKPLWFKKKF